MDIQIASDLHLELEWNTRYFEQYPLVPSADILVLAGDIMILGDDFVEHHFWDRVSKDFKQVYFLPGNHEYYNGTDVACNISGIDIRHNVHLMNNDSVVIDDNMILFTTLWSNIPACLSGPMLSKGSDFKYIMYKGNTLSIEAYNKLNEEALLFLKSQLVEQCKNKIVVSHHVPLLELLPARLRESWGASLYFNRLDDILLDNNIHSWIYGHSHYSHDDSTIYGTKFYTNPFGYQANRQNPDFKLDKYIHVD